MAVVISAGDILRNTSEAAAFGRSGTDVSWMESVESERNLPATRSLDSVTDGSRIVLRADRDGILVVI